MTGVSSRLRVRSSQHLGCVSRPRPKEPAVKRFVTFAVLVFLACTSAASLASPSRVRSTPTSDPVSAATADALGVVNYYGALAVAEYLQGLQRAEDDRAAENARLEALRAVQVPQARSTLTITGSNCCTHSDAWWQGVAICEQGGRNDPYFGYFSFMDGSMGGQPWSVQVAAGNALLQRVGHEVGPWAASCVAAGYNASPSG